MFYATLMVTVRCDECDARLNMEADCPRSDSLHVTFTVRSMARGRGWGTRRRDGEIQDACPRHKEE